MAVIAVVACAAGGLEGILDGLIRPLVARGHTVPVVVTPTAASGLEDLGHEAAIQDVTGLPVRSTPRLQREQSPHPAPDVLVAAPMTANSTAKLALGLADNQALTSLCENLAIRPTVVFPRVNAGSQSPAGMERPPRGFAFCRRRPGVRRGRLAAVRAPTGSAKSKAAVGSDRRSH